MGIYLQTPQPVLKAAQLEQLMAAQRIERPKEFTDVPQDKYLLCVVENPTFDAALVCYSEAEFIRAALPDDPNDLTHQRSRTWMLIDKTHVHAQLPMTPLVISQAPPTPEYLRREAQEWGVLS